MFGPQFSGEFLQNATLASVSGSVVTETRGLLLLDTSSGQVSIQIPNEWNIGSQVVSGATLFNGAFASSGQTVTLQVLESNVFSNTSFTLNEMVGYQATNATGTTATRYCRSIYNPLAKLHDPPAILPFFLENEQKIHNANKQALRFCHPCLL